MLGELCAHLDVTRQAVTKHLQILEEANLVAVVRSDREKLHHLNPVPIDELASRWIGCSGAEGQQHLRADPFPYSFALKNLAKTDTASSTYFSTSSSCMWLEPSTTWKALSLLAARRKRSSLIHLLPAALPATTCRGWAR